MGIERNNELKNVPFLAYRHQGRSYFIECEFCFLTDHKDLCTCDFEKRSWIGHYHIPELEYAINKLNYKVTLLECMVYLKSERIFASFFKTLARYLILNI